MPPTALALAACLAADPITLREAVQRAQQTYPSLKISAAQTAAAAAQIRLARTAYLPKADLLGQLNRGTHNNVLGLVLPQQVFMPISGPVNPPSSASTMSSALGLLVSWEPFDFGRRAADVAHAESGRLRAEAAEIRTRFEAGAQAADAYLTALAAAETAKSARASLDRARALEPLIAALTSSGLRPGADLARARAEAAQAELQVAAADLAIRTARVTLAQFTGADAEPVRANLFDAAPDPAATAAEHPLIAEQQAAIAETRARAATLDKLYLPRFQLQAAGFGRGAGVNRPSLAYGLFPNVGNWGLGMTVTFPLLDLPGIRARREAEAQHLAVETARRALLARELDSRRQQAQAQLEASRRMAALTPAIRSSAAEALQQATARYRAGLSSLTEVLDAQRLLTEAETGEALSRLNVWRARLALAAAQGDLEPFLAGVR